MNNIGQLQKTLGFNYYHETEEEAEGEFAELVKYYTGDWISEIECGDIQAEGRPAYD